MTTHELTNTFKDALLKEAEKRRRHETFIPDPHDKYQRSIPGWVLYERLVMYQLVNECRKRLGRPAVSWNDIFKVETMALGHSDYTTKYARYCAELALE